jgi:predicted phosphate transport protein (TIGR00153 family)
MFRFLPKDEKYFDLFNRLAAKIAEAAKEMEKLFADFENRNGYADRIKEIEHECDDLTHDIVKRLNQTFITPIDREDIHALATGLDDVVDAIDYTARRLILYRVDQATPHSVKMTDVLVRLVTKLEDAVMALEKKGDQVLQACVDIHTLESEGDSYHHDAVGKLFSEETDAITIIKMKEIYEKMERTIDKCEDVANVLEAIVLKNA